MRQDDESYILNVNEIIEEIEPLKRYQVKSFVELTTNDMGRDVQKLAEISKKTGFHIVCATGFYLEDYHSEWLKKATVEEISDLFIKELMEGIDNTDIKAGIIGEIATSYQKVKPSEKKVFEAAARVSAQLGCPINTHSDMGTMGNEQCDMLLIEGVNPDKIILGHNDLNLDENHHLSLLQRGVNLAFDTVSQITYHTDEARANHIKKLINQGYEDHIVLSQDVSRRAYFKKFGQEGYEAVMGYFVELLEKEDVTKVQIEKMLVTNPARILNWEK